MSHDDIDTARYYLNRRKAHCRDLMSGPQKNNDDTIAFIAKEMADIRTQEALLDRTSTLKAA